MTTNEYRQDFPILQTKINDEPLTYLDNAATSQKPQAVIDAMADFYAHGNANVHRGVYTLAAQATDRYEAVRDQVAQWLNAARREEVFFTRSTTDSLNWVVQTYGEQFVTAGDEIVVTVMEHHSNLVPWQQLAHRKGATLKYIGLSADGQLDLADARKQITAKTKVVAVAQASNVLGVTNPIKQLAQIAHAQNAILVVDGAQSIAHMAVDVQDLDADFYAFSAHKIYGPTGVGVLYGKYDLLAQLTPAQFGGEMISDVDWQTTEFAAIPERFEAGTPNICGVIGLGAALTYLQSVGLDTAQAIEQRLTKQLLSGLVAMPGITVYGPESPELHGPVVAFNVDNVHAHDIATGLDLAGVEIRAGHHCAQPLMRYLHVNATVRASVGLYNNSDDVDRLLTALESVKEFFES